ncbi:zwei Ig domain protein zig-8 isoform X2 [Cherax quadricarinatus]|uniref:zwei Ig domain protein zig-8 isoform X2 n=1 Tax=Cherax quadricarinatus TaxID=27406 RepID=UPI002377FBE5|nr:zwei Ig domain protein zig-8-like [Cherax quadricarinatus]
MRTRRSALGCSSSRSVSGAVTLVTLAALHTVTAAYVLADTTDNPQRMWDPEKGSILGQGVPAFGLENVTVTNQTAQLGSTAFLHCQVRNMADKQVSWIRRRDYHILTSGLHTYSRDERFGVVRPEDADDWALQIKFVQKRDEGAYECQVSTKTGRYGYLVNLKVVVPEAVISGSSERHVQSGSTISLLCIIEGSLTPPQFIFWYHNNKMINYDQSRGGITVTMDHHDLTTSRLTINNASLKDSGNYSCSASNIKPSSVNVFVSEGDKTAAIQRLGSGSLSVTTSACGTWASLLLCVQLFLLCVTHLLLSNGT